MAENATLGDAERHFRKLERLLEVIVSDLEASEPQTHWTDWMRESLALVRERDLAGVRYFNRAHGGMGSFNDWSPMSAKGHQADMEARKIAGRLVSENVYDSGKHPF